MTTKTTTEKEIPEGIAEMALERLKSCGNVTALAKELGVHRTLLYKWRERMEAARRSVRQSRLESESCEERSAN